MEALMVIGTVFSVVSALKGGEQQKVQYQAQAQASNYNSTVKRQRAETVQQVYGQREEQQRRESRFDAGRRRALIAQSGSGFGGSNELLDSQSETMAELDALNIRYEGELEAKGLLDSANLDDYYSSVDQSNASAAGRRGYIGAAGAILSGASDYSRIGQRRTPAPSGPKISSPYSVTSGGNYGLG